MADTPQHDAKELIFNYSKHLLSKAQESILMKGLNYALPPKRLKYEDYLLDFELFFTEPAKLCKCLRLILHSS